MHTSHFPCFNHQVAEERGLSPVQTRSAKKNNPDQASKIDESSNVAKGLFMDESPDEKEIRQLELQKEKMRDERLKQQEGASGEVFFLSPKRKNQQANDNQFCLQLSPDVDCKRPMSRASSVNSALTFNSTKFEELQARVHALDKENASLRVENKMLESNHVKLQQKFDDEIAKRDTKNQKLLIENAKLQENIKFHGVPVLKDHEEWKNMETKLMGIQETLGEFKSERSLKQLDYEYALKIQDLNRTIDTLQTSLKDKEAKLEGEKHYHQEALKKVQEEAEQHKNMSGNVQECIKKLEEEKEELLKQSDQSKKDLEAAMESIREANQQKEDLEAQLGSVDQNAAMRQNELEKELEEICLVNESHEKKILDLENALRETKDKETASQDEIARIRDKLEESMVANGDLESRLAVLLDENKKYKVEIASLTKKLEDMTAEHASMLGETQKRIKNLKNERDNFKSALQMSNEELERRERELQAKLDAAKMLIQEKDTGITDLMEKVNGFSARESDLLQQIVLQEKVRRTLHNKVIQLAGNIRCFVRVRPCIKNESPDERSPFSFPTVFDKKGASNGPTLNSSDDVTKRFIIATEPAKDRGGLSQRRKRLKFGFDNVFSPRSTNQDVWNAAEPLIQSAVDGYNVCIFAYGQTGSGKTFTMLGGGSEESAGIVTHAVNKLFAAKDMIEDTSQGSQSVQISVELLEIYNEQVRDLLSKKKDGSFKSLNIAVNSNEAIGNIIRETSSVKEVTAHLDIAQSRRCVKATQSNEESSRSHLIFTINFVVTDTESGTTRKSKLHICDLAGSERLSKSKAVGSTLKETQHINKSLSTLSNVIEKLQSKAAHVPYRESKLTYLLRNSLGGDSKTLAIVCCNPLGEHYQETACSLRFANKLCNVELKSTADCSV